MNKNKYLFIIPLVLLSLTVITGAFLMSSNTYADDTAVDNVSVNIPVYKNIPKNNEDPCKLGVVVSGDDTPKLICLWWAIQESNL